MFKSIAIDGPAGAGKSDVSSIIAQKMGFVHVDTGAIYRAVAFHFCEKNINISSESLVENELKNLSIKVNFNKYGQKVFLNENDVSKFLRRDDISKMSSKISPFRCVRNFLLPIQRKIAGSNNVVMDGRDIATVVLPKADVKIFLTASLEERAKRRYDQLRERKITCDYKNILNSIKNRDYNDSTRENSPLEVAKGSIFFDTTGRKIDEVVEFLMINIKRVIN